MGFVLVCLDSWGLLCCDPGAEHRRAKGLAFIVVVALIWVASSFAVQAIEEDNMSPFMLTYIANSLFAVLLPVHFVLQWVARRGALLEAALRATAPRPPEEHELRELVEDPGLLTRGEARGPLTRWETLQVAASIWPLWFLAQLCFNVSLSLTSVTSNTILSSASSLFTLLLSVWFLGERFSALKLACIAVCIAGTAMVTLSDSESAGGGGGGDGAGAGGTTSGSTVGGDALCLLAALLYAGYTVALRRLVPGDDRMSMSLMFGMVGALNLVVLGPVAAGLAAAGRPGAHPGGRALLYSLLKGLFDNVLSDYLWARAVLLTSPTVATLGLSIQVPIAIAAEVMLGRAAWLGRAGKAVLMLVGGVAVLAGFFGINLAPPPPDTDGGPEGGAGGGRQEGAGGGAAGGGWGVGEDGGGFWDSPPSGWGPATGRAATSPGGTQRPSLGDSGGGGERGAFGEGGGYSPPSDEPMPDAAGGGPPSPGPTRRSPGGRLGAGT